MRNYKYWHIAQRHIMKMARDKFYLAFVSFNLYLLLDCPKIVVSQSIVRSLPGFNGPLPFELETGYVGVDDSNDAQLFYYFVKSERKPSEDPLVLWITGGPGCTSFTGLAFEIGPLYFKKVRYDGSLPSLTLNPNSWTKVSSIIFLDSPVLSGFSYSRTLRGSYTGDIKSAKQTYIFLRKWLVNHPEFLSNPFYIGGDSYSGTTVPIIAQDVSDDAKFGRVVISDTFLCFHGNPGNIAGEEPFINLKGYLLGNPVTDQHMESNMKIPFAHGMAIISDELYESVKLSCKKEYVDVDPINIQCVQDLEAVSECTSRLNKPHILEPKCPDNVPNPKRFNGRVLHENSSKILLSPPSNTAFACRSYSYILSYYWANNDNVQRALNVRKGTKEEWIRCNYNGVHYTSEITSSVPYHQILSRRNYRSLIYSGDHDHVVPYMSTQAWIRSLNYPIVDEWRPWFVDTQVGGYTRTYANNMTFATVKGGGHTAPEYRAKECYAMFERWISEDPL